MSANPSGIGQRVRRIEDPTLLRGLGRFIDDLNLPGQAHARFVRSPVASGSIRGIDAAAALAMPGVLAVLTGADLAADGIGRLHTPLGLRSRDGTPIRNPVQLALAAAHTRFVGDALAMVVAESPALAADAALAVAVEIDAAPSVVDAETALGDGAPLVWAEMGTNLALDWAWGDVEAVASAFARAAHVTRITLTNNRLVVAALEPRGVLARYDPVEERYTVWTPTQGGTQIQLSLADPGLGVAPSRVRVITPEVGGGFGIKNGIYPEQVAVAWAARRLQRPVKWYADRSESFLADYHARDHEMTAELALDADGRFLAIRSDVVSNMGAYLTGAAPVIPTSGGTRMLSGVYRIPLAAARTRCAFTHTTPIFAFRGAGKPEYGHLVERVVDAAAAELGIDPVELRRRNLVRSADMPWRTPTGLEYDSGDFEASMDEALRAADREGLARRRHAARRRGRLLGQGFSVYTEPDGYKDNRVEMSFDPAGHLTIVTSGQSNGQGHGTVLSQIACSLLGVDLEAISFVAGDTDRTGFASGTGGSRTTTVSGAAMHHGAELLVAKGRRLAAHLLESSPEDLEHADGRFRVAGTDRSVGWREVSSLAHDLARLPKELAPGLEATHHYDAPVYCYPSGCHVCEVEIDGDTGAVEITRYSSVSDFGTVINPMLLEGQLHGGIAQGIGQALFEHTVYDRDTGQLLSGSFMDYCVPRASQIPRFETTMAGTSCLTNPLGVKGCGESGPTAALPAVMSAVLDALRDFPTDALQMPLTAERIWRVLRAGG